VPNIESRCNQLKPGHPRNSGARTNPKYKTGTASIRTKCRLPVVQRFTDNYRPTN
jgi:hypothetical protein